MRGALAALLVSILVLAGCATTASRQPESPDAMLARAVTLVETGTVTSLTEAARLLAAASESATGAQAATEPSGDARSAPAAPVVQAVAGRIFVSLYPELTSPFADAPMPADSAVVSPFLGRVVPALEALGAGPLPEPRAAALLAEVAVANFMNPSSVLPPWLQARLEQGKGSAAAVVRPLLEESLHRDPGFYPAARELSALIVAGGTAAAELPRLEQLAALMPLPALRFDVLARAELAAGQPQKAADAAAQGLLAAPEDTGFVLLRAEALDALGDWYQSLKILDAALRFQPDLVPAMTMKARILHDDEKNDLEALRVLSDAETRFPKEAEFPELRGRILLDMGKPGTAEEALKRALAIDSRRTTTLSLLLRGAAAVAHWQDAQSWLEQIPDAARSENDLRLGWLAAESLGSHETAIGYARALGARGASAPALELEARALIAAGRAADALAAADRGVAAADTSQARSTMYVIRAAAGSTDPLTDLRFALRENPDNIEALAAIADALAAQGELRKASEYARRAAALDPGNASLAAKAADLAARAGSGG